MDFKWIERELLYPSKKEKLKRGSRTAGVAKIQEWLTLRGHDTAIDGDFGPATERCLRDFQSIAGLNTSGRLTADTWSALINPLHNAASLEGHDGLSSYPEVVFSVARAHLENHPREVGGANMGPWVRIYMNGNQGAIWPWCAGFVSLVLAQAGEITGHRAPLKGTFSCDLLARNGQETNRFVKGIHVKSQNDWDDLGELFVFLVRRTASDWTHTGFGHAGSDSIFRTIEGNTNVAGSREGIEVRTRVRANSSMDFIKLNL